MSSDLSAPPGRRLRADARRNRDRILAAAQEVFADSGLAVPLDDIARRAGVGAGTIYRHFPTKEALFEAIVTARFERLTEAAHDALRGNDAGAAFFGFLRFMLEQGHAKRDLIDAMGGAGLDIASMVQGPRATMLSALALLLGRAQTAGVVRDDIDVDDLMALLAGLFMASRQASQPPERLRVATAVVFDGLRARSP